MTTEMTTYRDDRGRFLKGCPAGPGNPLAPQVATLRAALLSAVTPDDITATVRRLIDLCHDDDKRVAVQAMELFFNRVYGKPVESVTMDVTATPAPPPAPRLDLTPDELAVLQRVMSRNPPTPRQ
ncbi:MAG: hypothetical protein K2P78_09175 [Gemmataceae bacterium]|nr:hypothetical protein [Gemmataceae bacterium]